MAANQAAITGVCRSGRKSSFVYLLAFCCGVVNVLNFSDDLRDLKSILRYIDIHSPTSTWSTLDLSEGGILYARLKDEVADVLEDLKTKELKLTKPNLCEVSVETVVHKLISTSVKAELMKLPPVRIFASQCPFRRRI